MCLRVARSMCQAGVVKQCTQLIRLHGKQRQWARSLGCLEEMREQRLQPDIIAYNATISACAKGQQWQASIGLLAEMQVSPVGVDTVTYNATISACAAGRQWQQSLGLLQAMRRSICAASTITYTAAVASCAKGHQWEAALGVLVEMRRFQIIANTITYGAAISACEKEGQWQRVANLLDAMRCSSTPADTITFNAALSACGKGGQWMRAMALLEEMRLIGLARDIVTFSAAISACGQEGQWIHALALLDEMRMSALQADTTSHNAVISSCATGKQWSSALAVLAAMQRASTKADTITYNATITACEKGGEWARAIGLLEAMRKAMVRSNTISHSAAISSCEKGSRWAHALALLDNMGRYAIERRSVTYYAATRACEVCGQWEASFDVIAAMLDEGVKDDVPVERPYVHRFQAGGPADCFKHVVLSALFSQMVHDDTPFTYVDTHAGAGLYNVTSPEATKFGHAQDGMLQLDVNCRAGVWNKANTGENSSMPLPLREYLAAVRRCNETTANLAVGKGRYYPGSPALAQQWLRPQDQAIFFETSASVFEDLQSSVALMNVHVHCNVDVRQESSYKWLASASLDIFSKRGFMLIDPPYDSYESYTAWNLFMLRRLHTQWPGFQIALWYPCRDEAERASFHHRVQMLELGDVLVAEFAVKRASSNALPGSGMLLVNPVLRMDILLEETVLALRCMFAPDPGASSSTSIFWLRSPRRNSPIS